MKIQRPGNTEFNLVFAFYVENNFNLTSEEKKEVDNIYSCYIDWMYKTAGYYDKAIVSKSKYSMNDMTFNFKRYLSELYESYKDCDKMCLVFTDHVATKTILSKYVESFKNSLRAKEISKYQVYYMYHIADLLANKKVLVISPFKELIEQQIPKMKLMYNNLPNNVTYICYKYPYKFLNDGPHRNSFETIDSIKRDINKISFDVALLSCGADGGILTDYIHKKKKTAIYIGGHLPLLFGIFGKRYRDDKNMKKTVEDFFDGKKYEEIKDYIVTSVPVNMRPANYNKIEDGCYW